MRSLSALLVKIGRELAEQCEQGCHDDRHRNHDLDKADAGVVSAAGGPIPIDYSEWGPHG